MLLSVDNLSVAYGGIHALQGVSLSIERGEIVTLIGANGAGKTTLLRTISGLLRPAAGEVRWHGNDLSSTNVDHRGAGSAGVSLTKLRPHQIVRLGVSHVPEGRQVFPSLTVRENLLLGAYQQRDAAKIRADLDHCYELFPILAERAGQRSGTLSGGEQQMLAIGRALMARPALLLLDEPSLGLAPLIIRKIFQIVRDINAAGTTVFLVEQNAHMALTIAHRAYVLQSGQIVQSGAASDLLDDPKVKAAYLGG